MTAVLGALPVDERARLSCGSSSEAIYRMVARAIQARHPGGGKLLDIGCGAGRLRSYVMDFTAEYAGVDVVRYDGFPGDCEFQNVNLDAYPLPLPARIAEVVVAVETIEHLENPRALMRELFRLAKPGGLIVVTTPNQLSLLSKMTLLLKNQFNAFQRASYPAHLTALLECDLIRIAQECSLGEIQIRYSDSGRIPFTAWHWPAKLGFRGRAFSDNILIAGVRACC